MDQWGFVSASSTERDAELMRRAIDLARKGWGRTAPNPMVGAVVVRGDEVVGEGAHEEFGGPHAEVVALSAAGERARGATMYVTLEPCNHHGKTPPCTRAIVEAGIARVVIAVEDPTPLAGGGADYLRERGVEVTLGVEAQRAADLIAPFLFAPTAERPFITLKLALSSEGAVADKARSKQWLTGERSREEVHRLRAQSDAIGVGVGTVLADDPQLTVRGKIIPRAQPARVVFDRNAKMPMQSTLVRTASETPTIVVTMPGASHAEALRSKGIRVVERSDTRGSLEDLRALGIQHLFVEGGASLAGDLLANEAVDRLVIFQTPLSLGEGGTKPFPDVESLNIQRIVERSRFGDDEMTAYALHSK
jgi:diaminohydroxyphosphoribosylaminopyrimidine deaminase/5-amino-6-(5-phosphoribosylamino)uracil reductase